MEKQAPETRVGKREEEEGQSGGARGNRER